MIFLTIVRRCHCEMCQGEFDLAPEQKPPLRCPHCRSVMWIWGPYTKSAAQGKCRVARQGLTKSKVPKALNPGAASRKRQEHGKKQWRQFLSKENYEARQKAIADQKPQEDN